MLSDQIKTLIRRNHLILMNSTHSTNHLDWFLFTMMMQDECDSWILCNHFFIDVEDENIINATLRIFKNWCHQIWHLRYFLTDDSVIEQREVKLVFKDLLVEKMKISHLLCQKHFKRTFIWNFSVANCKMTFWHLYMTLYTRHTSIECEESITATINATLKGKKDYIWRKWWNTKH